MLFRRVQLLEPNERSQFVIGVTMAQRGATGQARKMLSKIAPDDRPGYAAAHAWIAFQLAEAPIYRRENLKTIKHHVKQAAKWDRVPEQVLLVGSQLLLQTGERDSAIALMKKAAERNAAHHLGLVQVAKLVENKVLLENSALEGEKSFAANWIKIANDLPKRLALAQLLAMIGRLDEAEQTIQVGMQIQPPATNFRRGLSEIYRLRFLKSLQQDGNSLSGICKCLMSQCERTQRILWSEKRSPNWRGSMENRLEMNARKTAAVSRGGQGNSGHACLDCRIVSFAQQLRSSKTALRTSCHPLA